MCVSHCHPHDSPITSLLYSHENPQKSAVRAPYDETGIPSPSHRNAPPPVHG